MIAVQVVAWLLGAALVIWYLRGVICFIRSVGYSGRPGDRFSTDSLPTWVRRDVVVDALAAIWPIAPWLVRRRLSSVWATWVLDEPPSATAMATMALRGPLPSRRDAAASSANDGSGG